MAKKTTKSSSSINGNEEIGLGLDGLAKAVEGIGEELHPLYHLETLADNVEHSLPLNKLADAVALYVIATYGDSDDRDAAVSHLKGWFEDFKSK